MRYFQVDVRKKPTEHGFMPTMQLYLLKENDQKRPIVVIVPGGGYTSVCIENEAEKIAMQYNAAGFHAAVLNYCVKPHCFPDPQKDLMFAIRILRENAELWGIQGNGIALCGFSAGAHLCASVSTLWHKAGADAHLYQPNGAMLFYPILTTRLEHCRYFLKGHTGGDEELLKWAACDEQVTGETPPTFLYGTFEDKLSNVENMLYYAEKLSEHRVPFEMHVLPKGNHGAPWCESKTWAKKISDRSYHYIGLSIEWLIELFDCVKYR